MNPFFTVGHSTRTIDEFVALLRNEHVELVVDVRTVPRSRRNPQYNRDVLPTTLKTFDLDYVHVSELGGLRSRRPVPPTVNGFWQNESFHNFADYAMGEEFRVDLRKLREAGHARRCAVMCAEAVWWRCHRRIIADYLIAAGETVVHILAKGRTELARITEAAVHGANCTLVYPPASTIVGYHQDEEKHWVAELSCGHQQHVRHRPPFVDRPWVLTESGRLEKIGHSIACTECARSRGRQKIGV
jgi:Protein of unknown function, DUF488/Protein of unknown function (DUF3565)